MYFMGPKGYGFYFSKLSHTSSFLPRQNPILRVFFPSGFGAGKKNRKPKLSSSPKKGKKRNWFEKNCDFFVTVFFFRLNPEGKKKPFKFVLPSYFFGRPTVLYVITWKKKPYPFAPTPFKFRNRILYFIYCTSNKHPFSVSTDFLSRFTC